MEIIDQNQTNVSTKEWFITILITAIPIVGFVMLFVWAFSDGTKASKANWAKATLLWFLVAAVLYGIIAMVFGAAILSNMN